ncbi:pickpocket protein 28-like [Venturia canescens]|uniref:pickpocket protein 28-like n=1 Tax=Venturia canescens TaxID=32260 RepID=UPI001C9C59EB|nr:pickpocket protein 28-like [Venturia canescens]
MGKEFTTKLKNCGGRKCEVEKHPIRELIEKRKWKCIIKGLVHDAQNYCETTTLHGFHYITSNEVTCTAKITWLTVCCMSSSLCIYLMLSVWNKYTMTPAIISVESTTYPLWGFPFPAVSICNFNKVYKPRGDILAEKMKYSGMNDSEIACFFDGLPSIVHEKFSKKDFYRGTQTLKRLGFNPETTMYTLMQPCDKFLVKCRWLGKQYNCSTIFKTVKTVQGFCCAFNYHVLHGEYPYDGHNIIGMEKPEDDSEYPGVFNPLMIPGSGRDYGLFVAVNVESETYRAPIRGYFGASVMIHDPLVYPEINIQSINIQPGQEVSINLKGSVIESEESLRSLSLNQRKCFFDDENKLNTSSLYRYESCISECRMEYIFLKCGCVPFYYPNTMKSAPICGLLDLPCLRQHRNTLALLEASSIDENANNSNMPPVERVKCRHDCLPQCTDRSYTLTSSSAWFMSEENFRKAHINEKPFFESSNESSITVYFPDITCLKYRRETVMTWENLLAAFGGIFGLCIGGSFVSLVEIVYFLTIRIFRQQKIENSEKPLYARELSGPIENRTHVATEQLNVGWTDNFHKQFDFNKSTQILPKTMFYYPKQEPNKIVFTIDVSGYKPVN